MLRFLGCGLVLATTAGVGLAHAEPARVKTLNPSGAIRPRAVGAGMQGVDPATNKLVQDPKARVLPISET